MPEMKTYSVWDAPTRLFHWINAICVIALVAVGLVILNGKALEIPRSGAVKLKTIHVWIGYVFTINLAVRILWAFVGNRYARWRSILPGGRGYLSAMGAYVRSLFSGPSRQYLGHNPLGRLSITVMLLLLIVLAVTGVVLAGTDLFYPPIGRSIAKWVAAPGVDPASLVPNTPEKYDKAAFESMRAFRKPYVVTHYYAFYSLLVVVALHITGAVISEIRERSGNISATFTGQKLLASEPADVA